MHFSQIVLKTVSGLRSLKHCGHSYINSSFDVFNSSPCVYYSSIAAMCHNIKEPLKVSEIKEKKLKKGEVRYLSI